MRPFAYFLAFFLPPISLGVMFTLSLVKDLMILRQPDAISKESVELLTQQNPPESEDPRPYRALILLSHAGTQITDLLAPYEILARSGQFRIETVAPKQELTPTTGNVGIWPQYTFENAPNADLLVIPAIVDFQNEAVSNWVRERRESFRWILAVCEGSKVLARAGILDDHEATSHFIALNDLAKGFQKTKFIPDQRVVVSDQIITSAGVTASIDASLTALEEILGPHVSSKIAKDIRFEWSNDRQIPKLATSDYLRLFLRGGFDWFRRDIGVLLYDGVGEIPLAAALDTIPRTLSSRIVTLASERKPIRSQHGLMMIPTLPANKIPRLSLLWVPSTEQKLKASPTSERGVKQAIDLQELSVRSLAPVSSGEAFSESLRFLARVEGAGIARLVAKLIEYPAASEESTWGTKDFSLPWNLIFRAFFIGLIGLAIAVAVDKRLPQDFFRRRWRRRR